MLAAPFIRLLFPHQHTTPIYSFHTIMLLLWASSQMHKFSTQGNQNLHITARVVLNLLKEMIQISRSNVGYSKQLSCCQYAIVGKVLERVVIAKLLPVPVGNV